ncbi:ABC transporter permease subunit [Garciella nitratireducens]|uniref:ABC transporter permease subunit n=1 Tax=Garciella nitratireducens TaxID=218205 RepID=UPI000DE93726|nr:ABC transporter permease subunit [Garciella nitratireducens]RBP35937.1 hypothetical protein DFR81_1344 [Garciella nitratireducens]
MNKLANEIIIKDIHTIMKNKKIIGIMCLVPFILTIIMPTIFIVSVKNSNIEISAFLKIFEKALNMSMGRFSLIEQKKIIIDFFIYNVLPIFFMLIPTMVSTIVSANSFVGEREKGTLETLFLAPLKVRDIFIAKVKVSILLSVVFNIVIFVIMSIVLNIVLYTCEFNFFFPNVKWWILLIIASLGITILSTTFVIKKSKNSDSVEEAQQAAVFVILPIISIVVGQFTGFLFISTFAIFVVSLLLLLISIMVMKIISIKMDYYA